MTIRDKINEQHRWLDGIEKEIADLRATQKYYKLQSEYHRMMYGLCLKQEAITQSISLLDQNN